jgi:hypothetical protein
MCVALPRICCIMLQLDVLPAGSSRQRTKSRQQYETVVKGCDHDVTGFSCALDCSYA